MSNCLPYHLPMINLLPISAASREESPATQNQQQSVDMGTNLEQIKSLSFKVSLLIFKIISVGTDKKHVESIKRVRNLVNYYCKTPAQKMVVVQYETASNHNREQY